MVPAPDNVPPTPTETAPLMAPPPPTCTEPTGLAPVKLISPPLHITSCCAIAAFPLLESASVAVPPAVDMVPPIDILVAVSDEFVPVTVSVLPFDPARAAISTRPLPFFVGAAKAPLE